MLPCLVAAAIIRVAQEQLNERYSKSMFMFAGCKREERRTECWSYTMKTEVWHFLRHGRRATSEEVIGRKK